MIHTRPSHGSPSKNGAPDQEAIRYRELVGRVEALTALVSKAKRAADESLSRAHDAPQPHETCNTIFIPLYEAHWRDREAPFSSMRQLDAAREALRSIGAEMIAADKPTSPVERRAG